MQQAIDEGYNTGGVGKHLTPFSERPIGGENNGRLAVTATDHFKQQVGVTGVVGQVSYLVRLRYA